MNYKRCLLLMLFGFSLCAAAQTLRHDGSVGFDATSLMDVVNVQVAPEFYLGKPALRVTDIAPESEQERMVILPKTLFTNGEIELDVAGEPPAGVAGAVRGFVGIAFHLAGHAQRFEYFYVRPTNGRADDQVRRNHSLQYAAHPDFPWHVLREKEPERYESYADMQAGKWIHIRAVINGATAQFFIDGASQPSLIVNDLKLGTVGGAIGLWIGPGTVARFANLRVKSRP